MTAVSVLALIVLALIVVAVGDQRATAAAAREAPALRALGVFVSRFGLSGYMLTASAITAGGAILVLRSTDRLSIVLWANRIAERAIFFCAAIAISGLLCQAIKHVVGRARPRFLEQLGAFHFAGPTFHSGFESFPSGHSTTAFAAAMALSLLRPAWSVVLFAAAVAICVARIFAEAHYPSDTVAGALLGSVATLWVARTFAARDVAFPVSHPLRLPAWRRVIPMAEERGAGAL